MHRWFFADDEIVCKDATLPGSSSDTQKISDSSLVPDTDWLFKVKLDWKLCPNESLAISGSCGNLGNWDPRFSLPLNEDKNDPSIWTLWVTLPRKNDIHYRYLVYAVNFRGIKIIRFWETHFKARLITPDQVQESHLLGCEKFGSLNKKIKIGRGWVNPYINVVQFKFYQAPFIPYSQGGQLLLQIKITPIKVTARTKCERLINPIPIPDASDTLEATNNSSETISEELTQTFAYCEVASLEDENGTFCKQTEYGTPCGPEHILMFNLTLDDIEHTAYLIDLYNLAPKSGPDVPPNHFGYQYVLPEDLKSSEGTLQLVIMCGTRHRPIGCMKCDYLVVRPIQRQHFNLEKTFQRYWNIKHEGMDIGHRGCGRSFWFQNDILRENTLYSFDLATKHGADMVEFDVHLTKDMVPVIFHDFNLNVSCKLNIHPQEYDIMYLFLTNTELESLKSSGMRVKNDLVSFPIGRFTLEQLKRVKVYEPPKQKGRKITCTPDTKSKRPFPTLEQVFQEIDCKTGFLVDLKWPQKVTGDCKRESLSDFDKNEFVDVILSVVFKNANSRRIVFSSFDADICTMVRLKQNIYPILFLIQDYSKEIKFIDPRGKSVATGIKFANAMEILGVTVNCSDILHLPGKVSQLHERDLCVFMWGRESRNEKTRKYLKALGVDGILCDRLNHELEPPTDLENIFYIVPIPEPLEKDEEVNGTIT